MTDTSWRERMRPCIASVLRETQGQSEREIRAALLAAWHRSGMGACENWPYAVWRDEIRRQRHPEFYSQRQRAAQQDSDAVVSLLPGLEVG